ncbi:MAG TPA: hypothetical protein VLE99_05030 [Candidatus Saccharimonadales bacterium]|nr:hypothetical protein [Candidatus Saccharimonadales bacterium]
MKRLHRWGIGLGATLLVAVPTVLVASHWMNSPSEGKVQTGLPVQPEASTNTPLQINNTYFLATLPAGFVVKSQDETPTATLVHLRLTANTDIAQDQQFAVAIGPMPTDGLRGIGDYNLRLTQTASYTRLAPPGAPSGAVAFQAKAAPATFTVFWPHGGNYAEVTMTTGGTATLSQLETTYKTIMASWAWK